MTLRATFLGTAGAVPTTARNPSSIHVNREGDEFLFDVGEGTQRQMMRYGTGFGISDILITHLHGDHVYGLPGLLETLEFTNREAPLTVHGPRGSRSDLIRLITACSGEPEYPLRVNEVEAGEVVIATDEYEIQAIATDHRTTAIGFVLEEADRKGRFDRERAEELGVPVGPAFSRLHEGEAVELDDGTLVQPDDVVGPPRPGRKLVYTGDTRPSDTVVEAAAGADLLIHDGTFGDEWAERAVETGHSSAREAGEIAARADVYELILTHISSRYGGDASGLAVQANEEFDGPASVAEDGLEIEVPFPEKRESTDRSDSAASHSS